MPANSIPMKGAVGPFGDYISMGGMFTIIKVRGSLRELREGPRLVSTPAAAPWRSKPAPQI